MTGMDTIELCYFCFFCVVGILFSFTGGIFYWYQTPFGSMFLAVGLAFLFFAGMILGYSNRRGEE